MKWIKATKFNTKSKRKYYARWGEEGEGGTVKSCGRFDEFEAFVWLEQGYVPVHKDKHNELYILDEVDVSAIDIAEFLIRHHSHDMSRNDTIIYDEKDVLELLSIVGYPAPDLDGAANRLDSEWSKIRDKIKSKSKK